jgi:hypothetical protein
MNILRVFAFSEAYQAVRAAIRQRSNQHTVDHGEHGGIGADTERERKNRRGCKSRRFPNLAQRELNVLSQS